MAGHLGVETPGGSPPPLPCETKEKTTLQQHLNSEHNCKIQGARRNTVQISISGKATEAYLCTLFHSTTSKSTTEIDLRSRVHLHVEIVRRTSKPNCRRTCIHCRTKRGNRRATLSQATIQPQQPHVPVDGEQLESDREQSSTRTPPEVGTN